MSELLFLTDKELAFIARKTFNAASAHEIDIEIVARLRDAINAVLATRRVYGADLLPTPKRLR